MVVGSLRGVHRGTFGILTLFGIIPACMAWSQRYGDDAAPVVPAAVPGGRATLAGMIGVASGVIALEVFEKISKVVVAA